MAAMEAVLAARRSPVAEAKPEAARGPGADLRFQVCATLPARAAIREAVPWSASCAAVLKRHDCLHLHGNSAHTLP